jgi:hypothetical protein
MERCHEHQRTHDPLDFRDRYNIVGEADLRDSMRRTRDYLTASAQQQERPAAIRQAGRIQ